MSVFMIWNGFTQGYEGAAFRTRAGAEEYIKKHRPPNVFWEVAEIRLGD